MVKLLKKIKFIHFFWFFFFLLLFVFIFRNSLSYLDPDLGWHLQVGREIAQTGQVPHINHYNYTYTGDWVDHEWLANFLVYEIYSRAGYPALNVFFAGLVFLTLIILFIYIRRAPRIQPAPSILAGLMFFGLLGSLPHLGIRIQEVALLFSLFVLLIIDYYQRRPSFHLLFLLPPLLYLWSSLHASFLFGLMMLFAWPIVKLLEKIIKKFWRPAWLDLGETLSYRKIFIFLGFSLASVGATLLTPYREGLYSFLLGYRNTFYMWHIQEWLPQYFFPFNYWQLTYLGLATAIFGLYIYNAWRKKYFSLNLWPIFLFLFLLAASFQSHRNFPLFFVVSFEFLILIFSSMAIKINFNNCWVSWWLRSCLIACLLLLSLAQIGQINRIKDPFNFFPLIYPQSAAQFLKNHSEYDSYNIFNEYVWGGYLIWTYPERQLFIDGRLPQVALNGHSFLEEYLSFSGLETDKAAKLAQYNIRLVLIKAKDQDIKATAWEKFIFGIRDSELKAKNYLREYLEGNSDWQPIYSDRTAAIYVKKN